MNELSPIKILYVDSDNVYTEQFKATVKPTNFIVTFSSNGKSGLQKCTADEYDILIIDQNLDDMSGLDVAEAALNISPDLPIILMVLEGQEDIASSAMDKNIFTFMLKYQAAGFQKLLLSMINRIIIWKARSDAFKDTEQKLIKNQERSDIILNSLPNVVFVFDEEGYYLEANSADHDLLVVKGAELEQMKLHDILPEDVADLIHANIRKAIKTGEVQHFDYELEVPLGKRTFSSSVNPMLQLIDGKKSAIMIGRDVTEIRSARKELTEINSRYEGLVQTQTDMICQTLPDGTLVFVNDAYAKFVGASIDQVIGSSIYDHVPIEQHVSLKEYMTEFSRNRSSAMLENSNTDTDGNLHFFQWLNTAYFDDEGNVSIIQSVGRDITEIRETQQVVQENALRNEHAVKLAGLGYWIWDDILEHCVYCTPEHAAIWGVTVEEYLELTKSDDGSSSTWHPGDKARAQEYIRKSKEEKTGYEFILRINRPDGEIRHVRILTEVELSEDGTLLRTLGSSQDLTDIKKTEAALIEAKNQAEMANRTKSEFLANMSHELRTPLNSILGFSQIMESELYGPLGDNKYQSYVKDIHYSGSHLLGVINDILDLSKVEAGEYELDYATFSLRDIVNECIAMIKGREAEVEGRIRLAPDYYLPDVIADQRVIRQVILNLISNAAKFTPMDGAIIITGHRTKNSDIMISVTDTGCGIAPEDQKTVMEQFGQARTSAHHTHEGTGLGLPLSKMLVELHGGRVYLESVVDQGTTVSFSLPENRVLQKHII